MLSVLKYLRACRTLRLTCCGQTPAKLIKIISYADAQRQSSWSQCTVMHLSLMVRRVELPEPATQDKTAHPGASSTPTRVSVQLTSARTTCVVCGIHLVTDRAELVCVCELCLYVSPDVAEQCFVRGHASIRMHSNAKVATGMCLAAHAMVSMMRKRTSTRVPHFESKQ
jgi:hypothetical protein